MKLFTTALLLIIFGTHSFAQTTPHAEIEREVCTKAIRAMDLLTVYLKRHNISASDKALKLLDTAQVLFNTLDKDSVAIEASDWETYKSSFGFLLKHNYRKLLADEKKARKVRVKLDGEAFMMSKNTFMVLYTFVDLSKDLFNDWLQKL